jgi:hypothetical protein
MSISALPTTTAGELSRRHRIVVLASCCTSLLAVIVDNTIVGPGWSRHSQEHGALTDHTAERNMET